jgi:5-methylcytosine-specific restriction endonuclease McrA
VSLRSLSDHQILARVQKLVLQEREVTLQVLLHLIEIERRRLHLKQGFQSLFEYCVVGLGYSAPAAGRRIQTARCMTRFACLHGMLERNEVSLSTIAQVSRVLTEDNHEELLSRIRGKSQREVEAILAEFQPGAMPRDRVRTVVVRVPAPSVPPASDCRATSAEPADRPADGARELPRAGGACEKSAYSRNESECKDARPTTLEQRVLLQFSVHPEFMAKLNRIKSLAWHRLPANASLEQVFELAMDSMLEKQDPAKRIERREKREKPGASKPSQNPRHVPASVRDQVFQRDGGRCAYVGSSGRRCNATNALQVDHITPIARGGRSTADNLRLLCAYHNRLEAERVLGAGIAHARAGGIETGPPRTQSRGVAR